MKAKGIENIDYEQFKDLLGRTAKKMHEKNPIMKTQDQRMDALWAKLDLLDPEVSLFSFLSSFANKDS